LPGVSRLNEKRELRETSPLSAECKSHPDCYEQTQLSAMEIAVADDDFAKKTALQKSARALWQIGVEPPTGKT